MCVLSDLQLLVLRCIKQVKDLFVVDLGVRADNFEEELLDFVTDVAETAGLEPMLRGRRPPVCSLLSRQLVQRFDLGDLGEKVLELSREDASLVGLLLALDRVRLARARLSVGEDGRVVPLQACVDDGLANSSKDCLLCHVLTGDEIEVELVGVGGAIHHDRALVDDLADAAALGAVCGNFVTAVFHVVSLGQRSDPDDDLNVLVR